MHFFKPIITIFKPKSNLLTSFQYTINPILKQKY